METLQGNWSQYITEISGIGEKFGPLIIRSLILLLLVLLVTKLLERFITALLKRMGVQERRALFAVSMMHILVLLLGGFVVLNLLGFPGILLYRIVAIALLVALAVYIIAKPFIPRLPFKVGDTVQIGDTFGKVEKITLMNVLVRAFDAKVIFFPIHKVLSNQVVNLAINPKRRLIIDMYIAYQEDLAKVRQAVMEILTASELVHEKPAPRVVIAKFTPDYRHVQARFWVDRLKALTGRWEINEQIDQRFGREGIRMAPVRLQLVEQGEQAASHDATSG